MKAKMENFLELLSWLGMNLKASKLFSIWNINDFPLYSWLRAW